MPIWSLSLPLVPESSDISIISMSLDMLSVCDVAGWSPAYIFFATPSDSRLWRGLPLWPTTPTYHPTFSQVAFSHCHQSTLNLGMLAEKAKLPVNVFGGRISLVKIKKAEEKVDLFTAENDLFVCGDAGEVFCPHLHCDSVSLGRSLGSMIPLLAAHRYTWE